MIRRTATLRQAGQWLIPSLLLTLAAVGGMLANEYVLYVATIAALWSILAVSYDVLLGYTGYLSLAHGTLYGLGGYACALLSTHLQLYHWLVLALSGAASALLGIAVALVAFRTRGLYFAVLTLAIGLVGYQVFQVADPLTGGISGFTGIPSAPPLFGLSISGPLNDFLYAMLVLWVTYVLALAFVRSPIGIACTAVREDVTLARSLGIRVGVARLAAFALGAFFAGVAGALFASMSNFIGPDSFSVAAGFQLVVLVIVGGKGTLWGPILGAVLLTSLPEALRFASGYSLALYGVFLLLFVLFAPDGIAGLIRKRLVAGVVS